MGSAAGSDENKGTSSAILDIHDFDLSITYPPMGIVNHLFIQGWASQA